MNEPNNSTVILIKLERKKREVLHLYSKLESYQFAPKTYPLFEKKERLKLQLAYITDSTQQLIDTIKNFDIAVNNYIADIKEKFETFNQIQKEFSAYFNLVQHETAVD